MKAPHIFFLPIFLCLNLSLSGQTKPQDPSELAETYFDYFSLNREAVFLHINKTKLAPQEDLWFSAYAYSPQSYLPNITTNLHVNLYNSEGKLMEAKTISMAEAKGEGFFELNSETYPAGDYLIRAGTKYMENFEEEAYFTQAFTILGETSVPIVSREYDLQLLPEGGHLVANVYNSVGVKLLDRLGKGKAFKEGKILNAQEEVMSTFKSNRFGLSKFKIKPESGEDYMVHVELKNGEKIKMPVPEPKEKGIVISSASMGDKMLFNFKTNKETFESIKGKSFLFAFHKDGAMKALNFIFSEADLSANLTVNKDALHNGVNTITVFNENIEPVLERLVFNRDSIYRKRISATYNNRDLDSLVINLAAGEVLEPHSMSISVLPAETISYEPENNIFSAFYLEPYIRGDVENGGYYFSEDVDLRRRDYDLDLLLLTQGWSKYDWNNIFSKTPQETFAHEHGFTLTGSVANRNPKTDKTLFIGSPTENLSVITDIAGNNSFRAENIFIKDSSQVNIGIITDKRSKDNSGIVARVSPARDTVNIDPQENLQVKVKEDGERSEGGGIPDNFILGAEELETVFLENEVLSEQEKNRELERELNGPDVYGQTEVFTDEEARRYVDLMAFLREKGFQKVRDEIFSTREVMRKPPGMDMGLPAMPAVVFIDGMESSYRELETLRPIQVKSVYINRSGAGARGMRRGVQTGGGLIEVVTKTPYARNSKPATTIQLANGFATSKEFYAPKYNSYNNDVFRNYGAIGWFPNVSLENRKSDLKIFDTRQPVKLFIEGMTVDGALISEEILIEAK